MLNLKLRRSPRAGQRGLSLIEAMVGLTVGLIIVAGATMLVTTQITEHRRLMTETQMQQDLRAAADLILSELRRAGSWEGAANGVWAPGGAAAPIANPYTNLTPSAAGTGTTITYQVTQTLRGSGPAEDNVVTPNEQRRFFWSGDQLFYSPSAATGTPSQPLTDPNSMKITAFSVNQAVQTIPLDNFCNVPCAAGSCPEQQVRHVVVSITGESVSTPRIVRHVELGTRLLNDRIVGSCS